MTEHSDDYKKGWFDGYRQAFDMLIHLVDLYPSKYHPDKMTFQAKCEVCGMSFVDSLGKPIIMGYVCNHPNCRFKIT